MIRDSKEFKTKLGLYRRYKNQFKKYTEMVEEIEYDLSKIPSTFPETMILNGRTVAIPKTHGDPHNKEIYRLEMIDLKAIYEETRDYYQERIVELDDILNSLPEYLKSAVMRVYVKREGMEKVAREMNYSKNGLAYYIDKELENVFSSVPYSRKTK